MEEEIILDEKNIIEHKLEILEKGEEKQYPKEQYSSQETSQYEKSSENEDKSSNKSKDLFPQNIILSQTQEEQAEKNKEKCSDNISNYLINYSRKKKELKVLSTDTKLKKAKNCSFMLKIKSIQRGLSTSQSEETSEDAENHLVISCHEIAALYFDEIYERIYTLEDLNKENRFFRIFESTDDVKAAIDEFIIKNKKNPKKFFIEFQDKILKIHMKLTFFDKQQELILNIPKKNLTNKQKNKLLPEFLREIQNKMFYLCQENKQLKDRNIINSSKIKELKYNLTNTNINKTFEIIKEDINDNQISELNNEHLSENNNKCNDNSNNNNLATLKIKKAHKKKKISNNKIKIN